MEFGGEEKDTVFSPPNSTPLSYTFTVSIDINDGQPMEATH